MGVLVFAQDITERKQTEEALRESEQRLRIMVESALNGMVMVNADGMILLANRNSPRNSATTGTNCSGSRSIGSFPNRYRHQQSRSPLRVCLRSRPQERQAAAGTSSACGRTGRSLPVTIILTPMTTEDGVYVVASVSDIPSRVGEEGRS